MELKAAIDQNIKEINKLLKSLSKAERKKLARPAAKMMQQAIASKAPVADVPIRRYSTPKVAKMMKAPKGMGVVVATYHPGNLSRSIKVLSFRKSGYLFVGPKVDKKGSSGDFNSASKVDGWYAHIVERNHPFIRPAAMAAQASVLDKLKSDIEVHLNNQIKKING
jgi:hypothetical protein